MLIRQLKRNEFESALPLIWKVFLEFEAKVYSDEGKKAFYEAIHSEEYLDSLRMFGAFDEEKLIGVIATRKNNTHIALFFVDGKYQGKGIGRKLFDECIDEVLSEKITVHSSLYAADIYRKLGFVNAGECIEENGIRYIPMMWKRMILETPRLILRRYKKSDLNDLYEYLSDPDVLQYEPYKPMTMAEVESNLEWRISTDEMIAVELKGSNKMIGNVYLGKRDFNALEIGFAFNKKYWNKGYAKESCEELIKQAFADGIHRIYAECDPQNVGSWRLLEALGFEKEAHLKRNIYFWKDDNDMPIWKDTYIYAKLNND